MASYQAGIVLRNALFRLPARVAHDAVPWVIYTDPEFAHVGLSIEAARRVHGDVRVLRWPVDEYDRALAERRPDVIYAPHAGEQHSDHHFVALAMQRAWRAQGCHGKLLGYEVWSPLDADIAVDVAETYPLKLAAIRCYATQLERNDIPRAVDGLNRFRAVLLPPGGQWAEVFEEYA
jgi:hypothetical protein